MKKPLFWAASLLACLVSSLYAFASPSAVAGYRYVAPARLQPKVVSASRHDTVQPLWQVDAQKSTQGFAHPFAINKVLPKRVRDTKYLEALKAQGDEAYNAYFAPQADTALDTTLVQPKMPSTLADFAGTGNVNAVSPPDPAGEIGVDPSTGKKYYVQWVNLSYAVWEVTNPANPTLLLGPVNGNAVWQGFGGACENNNDGDPIVLFDQIAHRWLLSQFSVSGPYYQCVAISASADPTAVWHRYAFQMSAVKFNDYGKFGVWPDGYYGSVNNFIGNTWAGTSVFALERAKMLNGEAANLVQFDLYDVNVDYSALLPADVDGDDLPAPGTAELFVSVDDNALTPGLGSTDAMRLWQFHVDWDTPANSTFGVNGNPNFTLPVTPFNVLPCVMSGLRNCILQPGGNGVDAIGDRLMYRLAYRNFGTHESVVVNHTVDAGSGRAGVRWYELRDPFGAPNLYQQQTYAPADGLSRWNASVAQDRVGNLALGYSAVSSSVFAGIRVAGRIYTDPLDQLAQGERVLVNGGGAQTVSQRWGDYSMLTLDPSDDCTFWYTNEYYSQNSANGWKTRINAFRFPNCGSEAPGVVTGTVVQADNQQPLANVLVSAANATGQTVQANSTISGSFELSLLPGSYTITAAAYGYLPMSVVNVNVTNTITASVALSLSVAATHIVSGVVSDANSAAPLPATIVVSGLPFSPPISQVLSNEQTGFYSVTLAEGQSYSFTASALLHQPESRVIGNVSDNQTQSFGLVPTSTQGALVGTVSDLYSLVPISGAKVVLSPGGRSIATGDRGEFQLLDVSPGSYTMAVSADLFVTRTVNSVVITAAMISTRTVLLDRPRLVPAPLALTRTLGFGDSQVDPAGLVMSNLGGAPLNYILRELDGDGSAVDGGPDAFGYTWRTSAQKNGPTFAWVDASDGTDLNLLDDSEIDITLPFAFPYYGDSSAQIHVGNNGALLVKGNGDVPPNNTAMDNDGTPNQMIAVMWDDIDGGTGAITAGAGNVYWKVLGSAPNRRVVVSWQDRPRFRNIGAASFQAILYEDGDVLMQYKDVVFGSSNYDNGQSATVGIRGDGSANSLQFSNNEPALRDGLAICFDNPNSAEACGQVHDALPWLTFAPTSTVLSAGQTTSTSVVWSATADKIAQPGVYAGGLIAYSNDPLARRRYIPVTLTVVPNAGQGLIQGLVRTTGECDNAIAPLADAQVLLQGGALSTTVRTDANGAYQYFVDAGSYNATASADEQITQTQTVQVSAGLTTTQDFMLRLDRACVSVSPEALSRTVNFPNIVGDVLTVTSLGAQPLDAAVALLPRTEISPARVGGPDGQRHLLMPTFYQFTDISQTGTALTMLEDGAANFTSPFSITLYGRTSDQLRVGENGAILFGVTDGDISHANTAMANAPNYLIAPFWDDLYIGTGSTFYQIVDKFPHRRLIVQWQGRAHIPDIGNTTFQVIFEENGRLLMSYSDVDFENTLLDGGANATIGIRGGLADEVVQYGFNERALFSGTTLCFSNDYAQCNGVLWLDVQPTQIAGLAGTPSSSTTMTVTFNSGIANWGTHYADLLLVSNAPSALTRVPITLTVELSNGLRPMFLPVMFRN